MFEQKCIEVKYEPCPAHPGPGSSSFRWQLHLCKNSRRPQICSPQSILSLIIAEPGRGQWPACRLMIETQGWLSCHSCVQILFRADTAALQLWVQAADCHVLLQGHLLLQRCWEETAVAGNVSSLAEPQSVQHCSTAAAVCEVCSFLVEGTWLLGSHLPFLNLRFPRT